MNCQGMRICLQLFTYNFLPKYNKLCQFLWVFCFSTQLLNACNWIKCRWLSTRLLIQSNQKNPHTKHYPDLQASGLIWEATSLWVLEGFQPHTFWNMGIPKNSLTVGRATFSTNSRAHDSSENSSNPNFHNISNLSKGLLNFRLVYLFSLTFPIWIHRWL